MELPSGMLCGVLDYKEKKNLVYGFGHTSLSITAALLRSLFVRENLQTREYFLLPLALDSKKLQPVPGLVQSLMGLFNARQSQTAALHHLSIHTAHPSCQSNPGHAHISHMKMLEMIRGFVFLSVSKESIREDL